MKRIGKLLAVMVVGILVVSFGMDTITEASELCYKKNWLGNLYEARCPPTRPASEGGFGYWVYDTFIYGKPLSYWK